VSPILQGNLRHFRAAELLTLLGENGHSGTLRVEADGRSVDILFKDGKVVWPAKEAVLDFFTWADGAFTFTEETTLPSGAVAVSLDTSALVEEGESLRRSRKIYPDDAAIVRPIENPAGQENISLTPDALKVLLRVAGGRTLKQLCLDLGREANDVYTLVNSLECAGLVCVDAPSGITAEMAPIVMAPTETPPIASLTGGTAQEVWPLFEEEYLVGRADGNAIVINDSTVSSKHARIFRGADGFYLEDLQSRNGTFVNGEPVTQKRRLADHDVIRFGRMIVTFNIASDVVPNATSAGTIRI
jgi:hypothetical protein